MRCYWKWLRDVSLDKMIRATANFILFQLAWFAAVIGGAQGWPKLGALPAIVVVIIHLGSHRSRLKQEMLLVLGVTVLGMVIETGFIGLGALHYTGTGNGTVLPPLWIIALWFAFGTLPHGSLGWLSGRLPLQLFLGAVFGPLSYLGGARLGAASLGEPIVVSLALIGCGWALAMALIFGLADRLGLKSKPVVSEDT